MGTGLIFPGLWVVTDAVYRMVLIGLEMAVKVFQEIAPTYKTVP